MSSIVQPSVGCFILRWFVPHWSNCTSWWPLVVCYLIVVLKTKEGPNTFRRAWTQSGTRLSSTKISTWNRWPTNFCFVGKCFFFTFNIPCQFWGFNYMKALQRESQALDANREMSVVSQKYFSLIKLLLSSLKQLLTDVIDIFLLDYWSEANSS